MQAACILLSVLIFSSCKKNDQAQAQQQPQQQSPSLKIAAPKESREDVEFRQCLERIEVMSILHMNYLKQAYAKIDPKYFHKIPKENETIFLRGKKGGGAVLLMHGILSSPDAMRLLAEEFNQQGMTVLAPLISGFGSTVAVANASSVKSWQGVVDYHYQVLSSCFQDIALVGFSLGGALSTDFTLNRYPQLLKEHQVSQMSSLLLLSPAIQPAEGFVPLKAGVTLIFSDSVPFWLVNKIKHDPDITEMMKHPDQFNQYFPVYVGTSLHELSKTLKKSPPRFTAHSLPVSLDYSQADTATDWNETRVFLTDHFFDVRIFNYAKTDKIPHTLNLKTDSDVGKQIRKGLARFITWYHSAFVADHIY